MLSVKQWAEEYKLINDIEYQQRYERLQHLSIEEGIHVYQTLCRLVTNLTAANDPALWEIRQSYYREWEDKMRRIAKSQGYDISL